MDEATTDSLHLPHLVVSELELDNKRIAPEQFDLFIGCVNVASCTIRKHRSLEFDQEFYHPDDSHRQRFFQMRIWKKLVRYVQNYRMAFL